MSSEKTVVYSPQSQLRSKQFLGSLIADLLASRELAWRLAERDIRARYRQSFLGFFWAFIPPIATAAIFIILSESKTLNIGLDKTGPDKFPYHEAVFILFGTVLWEVFVTSLNAPLKTVGAARPMLSKVNFPREALILSGLLQVLFDFLIKATILVAACLYFDVTANWGMLAFPLAAVMLMLLGTMFGLLLVPIGVLYTDVVTALASITRLWFFITPVAFVPQANQFLGTLMQYNPVTHLLDGARSLALFGTLPNLPIYAAVGGTTVVGLLAGWILYRAALPVLIERMNA